MGKGRKSGRKRWRNKLWNTELRTESPRFGFRLSCFMNVSFNLSGSQFPQLSDVCAYGWGTKAWLAVSGPFLLLWFISSCLWSWWPIYVNFSKQLEMGLWQWGVEERYSKHAAKFHSELLNHEAGTVYKFGMQFSPRINYFPCLFSFLYFLILSTFLSFILSLFLT